MKNKNGFTLVELLSTIAILAIVLGIVSAAYIGITKHLKASYYKTLEESILVSGGEYYSYTSDRPEMFGVEKRKSLQYLVENKYLTDIVDRKGNQCNLGDSYVGAYKDSYDKTNYYVCLTCSNDGYINSGNKPECSGNINYSLQMIAKVNGTNKIYQSSTWINSSVKLEFKTLNDIKTVYVKDSNTGIIYSSKDMEGEKIKTCNIDVNKIGYNKYEYYGVSENGKETKHGNIIIKIDKTEPTFDIFDGTNEVTEKEISKKITDIFNINYTVKNINDSESKVQSIRYSFEKQGASKKYIYIDNTSKEFNIEKKLDAGNYQLEIEIKDYAGNVNTRTINYEIIKMVNKPDSSYCKNVTYNGLKQTLTNTPGEGYTFTNNKKTDAGKYVVTVNTINSNYVFSDNSTSTTLTCTLAKKEVDVVWGTTTFTYNGNYQAPTATASSGVSGETLNITRTTEKNAGNYTSTASISSVTGGRANKNNYILTGNTIDFTIKKATPKIILSSTRGSVNAGSTISFTEKADITGSFSNVSGTTGVATVSPASYSSIAANTAKTVTITGVSNGTSKITVTFTPTDTKNYNQGTATYTVTVYKVASVGSCQSITYNGYSQTLASGGTGVEYSNNTRTNYGSQNVTVSLKSGYRWSNGTTSDETLSCSIEKRPVTIKADNQTITYGSNIRTSTSYITVTGLVSGHSVTSINLTPSHTNVTTSGTITPSGAVIKSGNTVVTSNYSISYQDGSLVINRKKTATIGSCQSVTYNGSQQVLASGGSNVTYRNNLQTDAGRYAVTIETDSNYAFSDGSVSASLTCTLAKKPVAVSWGSTTTFTYNGSYQAPTAMASSGVSGETLNITRTRKINAGSYTSTASISSVTGGRAKTSNYTLTGNTKSFTINRRSVTIKARSQTISYGDNIGTGTSYITSTGLVSGHSVTSINLSQSTTSVTTSGTITPSGAVIKSGSTEVTSNYSISYQNGTLTITEPEPPTVSISISGESYSSGYKSGAVATATCTSADGISSFNVTNNKSKTFSTTGGSYTKTATATYDGSTSGWQITVTCTGVSGESASTTATYKIYEYSRDSDCSCAERDSCKNCDVCGSSTTYGAWSGYTCKNPKPSSTSTKEWSCQKDPEAEFCESSKYYKCRSRSITTTCNSCQNSSCSCKTRNKCWHT